MRGAPNYSAGGMFDCGRMVSRPLKNYLRCRYGVKNSLKMLIYNCKLRFLGCFCLVSAASPTFFNSLLALKLIAQATGEPHALVRLADHITGVRLYR